MRLIILLLMILFFVRCASPDTKHNTSLVLQPSLKFFDDSTKTYKDLVGGDLLNAWEKFKEALIKKDFEQLLSLSTNCVHCATCDTSRFIEARAFYDDFFIHTFDNNFLTRMTDTSKVKGFYDDGNWHIYSQDCIFKSSGLMQPRIAEIFVKITDRDSFYKGFEGADAALAFISTTSGYKFCGYSTMP